MSFVDNKQSQPVCNRDQITCYEILIRNPLGRDEQDVELIPTESLFDSGPVFLICGIDRFSPLSPMF